VCALLSGLRAEQSMDVLTFHTLMMGHTKRLNHSRVLQLYDEALAANIEVSVHMCGTEFTP
jgi:hypothetical protein